MYPVRRRTPDAPLDRKGGELMSPLTIILLTAALCAAVLGSAVVSIAALVATVIVVLTLDRPS